jgi:O-antigen/teichoic acid export membrane protein
LFAALSQEIVLIVLGPQWLESALIFKVLALAAIAQPVLNSSGWVYISLNRTHRMVHWALFAVPVIVLSFVIGLPWGLKGVAIAYAICVNALAIPCLLFMVKGTVLDVRSTLLAVWRPVALAILIYGVASIVRIAITDLLLANALVVAAGVLASFVCVMGVLTVSSMAREEARYLLRLTSYLR